MKLDGGCLCGKLRYSIDAIPIDAGFCHCKICQKANGAPMVAWLTIPFSGFLYTSGDAAIYASSQKYQREFCRYCGSQIAFRATVEPKTIDITICTLDESSKVEPQYHIWCQSKVNWLHLNDELPQFLDSGPDGP
ncbi:glutathione-dependent formaldehyde-activating, GFA [Shewanella sp. MR-4]|uniref:GFA family protein n=1 Tax=Shewanella sp. (strain MR-4) TaxID=60480 RepID=UPI0000DE1CB1|nr:GFA family protein [Shewanella sp. MR-4]ABI40127.1 glutathione-dependent formaldehyde-activating, GFA [Shewanella sp. MR-4]